MIASLDAGLCERM